jgi:ribosomal protein S14
MTTIRTTAEKNRRCHSCGEPRGKRTAASGWEQDTDSAGDAVWTCPTCPRPHEPIRRMVRASGIRFRAVVDVGTRENRKQAS